MRIQFDENLKIMGFQILPVSMQPEFLDPKKYLNDISIKTSIGELYGEVNYPEGDGPFECLLYIPGSGPTDRDGNSALGVKSDYIIKVS